MERKSAAIRKELSAVAEAFTGSADLQHFLASPAVDRAAKHGVVEKLAARMSLSETLRNFLFVLVDNRRTEILGEIREAFEAELNAREGIAKAEITSAREMSASERQDLVRALERLTGKRIEARYGLEPALLGGAVVQIGSTIYDGSVREQLNRLRAELEAE